MTSILSPYLSFNGNCREAMEFYQSVLGGNLTVQTFGEAPIDAAEEHKHLVMHSSLESEGLLLMASDSRPGEPTQFGDNISLSLTGDNLAKLTENFNKLSEGGVVVMPLDKVFWGDIFGMLKDKYGINWMINISSE